MNFKDLLRKPTSRGVIKVCQLALLFVVVQVGAGLLVRIGAQLCGRDLVSLVDVPVLTSMLLLANLLAVLMLWLLRMVQWRTVFACLGMSRANACRVVLGALLFCFALNVVMEFCELPNLMEAEFILLANNPLGAFIIGILGPVCEELVFREAMIGTMRKHGLSALWAIGLSSFLFAVVHGNPAQIPFAFLVGCLLGWIYWITGNILLTSLIHMTNNSLAVVQIWLLDDGAADFSLVEWFGGIWQAVIFIAVTLLCSGVCLHAVSGYGKGNDA